MRKGKALTIIIITLVVIALMSVTAFANVGKPSAESTVSSVTYQK